MSSMSCTSYKDRNRILIMEKMVEDLKELTSQQNLTIKQMEKESLAKSNKISTLMISTDGKASLSLSSSRPSLHLSSHLASRSTQPSAPVHRQEVGMVDTNRLMQKRVGQIAEERDFWRRHFKLAEGKISDLQEERNSFKPQHLAPLQEISINKEPESLYLKKLLEENLDLKLKLAKHIKVSKSVQIVEPENESDQVDESDFTVNKIGEFIPKQQNVPAVSQPSGYIQPQVLRNPSQLHNPNLQKEVQHLSEHNKCLQHQVCKLKSELIKKANQFSCSCQTHPQAPKTGPSRGTSKYSQPSQSCSKCKNHLCKSRAKIRFEDKVDFSSIHLCSHIACLQRQVCHLKLELEQLGRKPRAGVGAGIEAEISKLEEKCDKLLDQKKVQLERISQLQEQVETLLKSPNVDSQVQDLIINIESQRDNYKHQVQKLIKDLKNDDRIILVNAEKSSIGISSVNGAVRTNDLPELRNAFQLPSNIRKNKSANSLVPDIFSRPKPVGEDDNLALELLEAKTTLADKAAELTEARAEVSKLRQKLDDCLAQLENYRVKHTQTSPRLERGAEVERRVKDLERKEKEVEVEKRRLDMWQEQLNKIKENLEIESSKIDFSSSKPASNDGNSYEVKELRQKVSWLEQQLTQTENTLRNCQNVLSENSNRSYELNSQILKLKQEGNANKKAVDELQLKLDKKNELVNRIIEDKDNLLAQLDEAREKLQSLESQMSQKRDRLEKADQSKDDLERRVSQLQVIVKQLERKVSDKESKVEELKDTVEARESQNRNLHIENSSLRLEIDHNRNALDKMSEESQSKSDEIVDIKSELKRFITEVKRFEELLDLKETDRLTLLTQYEELSKEVTAYESSNRSLEMQAANLMLEVKSREDDLAAAKQRCDSVEKYMEEVLAQNEQFRLQVTNLSSKVDMLSSDLKCNRVTRDSVVTDLESVNQLAVRLNTEKIDLISRIGNQNSQVENLQTELVKLREDLLSAMGQVEEERHRARTLQNMVTNTTMQEERQTVIRKLDREIIVETEQEVLRGSREAARRREDLQ